MVRACVPFPELGLESLELNLLDLKLFYPGSVLLARGENMVNIYVANFSPTHETFGSQILYTGL